MDNRSIIDRLSRISTRRDAASFSGKLFASCLFIMAVLFALSSSANEFEKLSDEEKEKLQRSEVVYKSVYKKDEKGRLKGHGQSMILVNAPLDKCWEIFVQFNAWHKYWPKITGSAVIEQKPGQALVLRRSRFSGINVEYMVRYTIDEKKYRIDFELDVSQPHDIEYTAGYFLFEKISPATTLFVYAVTELDTGLPVPEVIREAIEKRDLPACAENVKKRIESGGTWGKKKR